MRERGEELEVSSADFNGFIERRRADVEGDLQVALQREQEIALRCKNESTAQTFPDLDSLIAIKQTIPEWLDRIDEFEGSPESVETMEPRLPNFCDGIDCCDLLCLEHVRE